MEGTPPLSLSEDETGVKHIILFLQNFAILVETSKKVVWQSADGRVTSDDCHVTVQRLFSKCCHFSWNVDKSCLTVGRRSRDLRPLTRDRTATFLKFRHFCWNVEINCSTISRRSRDLRRLSRYRSATFFKILQFWLKRRKKVVWKSVDGRVTVGVRRLCFRVFFRTTSAYASSRMSLSFFIVTAVTNPQAAYNEQWQKCNINR